MEKRDAIKLQFAIGVLVAIPFVVHILFEGAYKIDKHGVFWIGPISTTLPHLFLALLFIAHCGRLKSQSWRSAYCGAVMAWLSMMGFTVFLVLQAPGPKNSSTMGIAVALTPFCYIPFLFLPYLVGAVGGIVWNRWKDNEPKP